MLALWYLAKKYVLNWPCEGTPAALKVEAKDPLAMLKGFLQRHPGKRTVILLYPSREEVANETLLVAQLESLAPRLAAAGVREIVSVGRQDTWRGRQDLYKDGIHPTPAGMALLAQIISGALIHRADDASGYGPSSTPAGR